MFRIKLVGGDCPASGLQGLFVGDSLSGRGRISCAAELDGASVGGGLDAACGDKCGEDGVHCGCGELIAVCPKISECRGYRAACVACEFGRATLSTGAEYGESGVGRKIRDVTSV